MLKKRYDKNSAALVHNGTIYALQMFDRLEIDSGLMSGWAFLKKGMKADAHQHPEKEIYLFTRGEGKMQIGDEISTVSKDEAVFIPSNAIHTVWNDGEEDLEFIWVSFDHRPLPYLTKIISSLGRCMAKKLVNSKNRCTHYSPDKAWR